MFHMDCVDVGQLCIILFPSQLSKIIYADIQTDSRQYQIKPNFVSN